MREILFRAKRKNWRELPKEEWWIEGNFYGPKNGMPYILVPKLRIRERDGSVMGEFCDVYEIDPETLCQYIGLNDKKGNRIWENDIVNFGSNLRVSWHTFKASWVLSKKGWLYNHFFGEAVEAEDVEVVGNFFDNPELLERG